MAARNRSPWITWVTWTLCILLVIGGLWALNSIGFFRFIFSPLAPLWNASNDPTIIIVVEIGIVLMLIWILNVFGVFRYIGDRFQDVRNWLWRTPPQPVVGTPAQPIAVTVQVQSVAKTIASVLGEENLEGIGWLFFYCILAFIVLLVAFLKYDPLNHTLVMAWNLTFSHVALALIVFLSVIFLLLFFYNKKRVSVRIWLMWLIGIAIVYIALTYLFGIGMMNFPSIHFDGMPSPSPTHSPSSSNGDVIHIPSLPDSSVVITRTEHGFGDLLIGIDNWARKIRYGHDFTRMIYQMVIWVAFVFILWAIYFNFKKILVVILGLIVLIILFALSALIDGKFDQTAYVDSSPAYSTVTRNNSVVHNNVITSNPIVAQEKNSPEATPQPTVQPTPEPTPESTPESTPQSTPVPTPQPTPQQTPKQPTYQHIKLTDKVVTEIVWADKDMDHRIIENVSMPQTWVALSDPNASNFPKDGWVLAEDKENLQKLIGSTKEPIWLSLVPAGEDEDKSVPKEVKLRLLYKKNSH